jgi:hypothetical protein
MTETTGRRPPWWQVTPRELAWRHGCEPDKIQASVGDPDALDDWQLDLVTEAVGYAERTLARLTVPDREDES